MNAAKIKKIKGQKTVAVMLFIVPLILVIRYLITNDFKIEGQNTYIIGASLVTIMIVGAVTFNRSSTKLKNLK